jgi:O-succinylbenzoic acid--CoA ligase
VPSFMDDPPSFEDLCTAVRVELGAPSVPKLIRLVDALPLHGVGKVDRAAVRATFA